MQYPTFKESHKRSITRSIIWRCIGVIVLALITYLVTRSWITTSLVTALHHGTFIFVYYLHERFWCKISWLRNSKFKPFARILTYEIILGNSILGLITFLLTGSLQQMSLITFLYIGNKLWIYYLYDWVWSKIRWQTRVTVYAYVAGDLPHIGHLRCLQQAKALGNYLIVGVLTDKAIEAYKRVPIIPFEERAEMFANFKCVDEVVRQDSVDPTENLKKLQPDIVVHGDDWNEDFPGAKYMKSIGRKAIRTKYYPGQSTTKIIELITKRIGEGKTQRKEAHENKK